MTRSAVVIEDDDDLRHLLTQTLEQHGFAVHAFPDGPAGVDAVRLLRPDLTTVDVKLDGIDGFEAVRRIRAFHDGYVLIISAVDDETATVEGFRSGADDYVIKPWRPYELRARIDALMRRPRALQPGEAAPGAWLEAGGLRLNPGSRRVELDGRSLDLTRSEFDVLQALMQRPGDVIEKAWIALMLRRQSGAPPGGRVDWAQVGEFIGRVPAGVWVAAIVANLLLTVATWSVAMSSISSVAISPMY